MKTTTALSLVAVAAALLSSASPATAGNLILDQTSPTFTPDTAFTNNTIVIQTTIPFGPGINVNGGATITPDATNQAEIEVHGTYSADAGDIFSAAYSFTADLNTTSSVAYTITGSATTIGGPVEFQATGTITPGLHKYEGTFAAPIAFPFPDSGDFSGTLVLNFATPGAPSLATPGSLDLFIQQVELKLDPIPAAVQAPSQSQNISTRANVGVDDHVLIGGFIVTGTDPKTVVLRAIGPSLSLVGVNGVLADPFLELHDSTGASLATNDNWMDLSAGDQVTLADNMLAPTDPAESALVATLDPGAYTTVVRGVGNTTGVGLVEAYDIDSAAAAKLANISTRGFVETGENVMIGGFILGAGGGGFSTIIVRGIGPSLTDAGITDALADPVIEIHNGDGDLIDSNDNWMDDPNMQMVSDAGLAPTDPNESALYKILPAGAYTAILSGAGGTSGVGLVESYNTD